jgi:hypothetical protein
VQIREVQNTDRRMSLGQYRDLCFAEHITHGEEVTGA